MDLEALDHDPHVERAIELAQTAAERGDGPYGTVLVRDGKVVMEDGNREHTEDDIALHPELTLARRAASEMTPEERAQTVMYTSTEPCSMCATGVAFAGLGGVVYSTSMERAAEIGGGPEGIPSTEVFERWDREIPVQGPVLAEEGEQLHREFKP